MSSSNRPPEPGEIVSQLRIGINAQFCTSLLACDLSGQPAAVSGSVVEVLRDRLAREPRIPSVIAPYQGKQRPGSFSGKPSLTRVAGQTWDQDEPRVERGQGKPVSRPRKAVARQRRAPRHPLQEIE